jgi:hypothetical protein
MFARLTVILVALLALCGPATGQYLITTPDSLLNNGAEYLVLTHESFTASVLPLCRLRDSLGLEVKLAEVGLVYSTFPTGPRTDRIKAFLQQVYDHWSPRPEFVLLVGDASKDTTAGDFLPVRRFPKFSYSYASGLTEHGIDNWYAQLAGADSIPDVMVGRLPVNSAARCDSLVAKIVRYETAADSGAWLGTAMVLASNDRLAYARQLESLYLRPRLDSVYAVYESQGNSDFLRARTRAGFNAGASFLVPCTHGTQPPAWVGSRYLFSYQDVESLYNIAALPLALCRG